MTNATTTSEVPISARQISPERMAWGVLLIAFAAFCILCATVTVGVHYFLFESTVNIQTVLAAGRGTAIIVSEADLIEQAVRARREILVGTSVSTDGQSQAVILFADQQQDQRLIATATLGSSSGVTLIGIERPRFDWSIGQYSIDLTNFTGMLDVYVAPQLGRDFRMTVRTTDGTQIYLTASGRYTIRANATQVQVFNREGAATLIAASQPQDGRAIPSGQRGVAHVNSTDIVLAGGYVELLSNPTFREIRAPESVPAVWECSSEADALPIGTMAVETVDERPLLHFLRAENASSHGEMRCRQYFDPANTGQDVRGYDELVLRATFQVNYQSLSACGVQGSECPLMLQIDYVDVNGNARVWYHGFYAAIDPTQGYPLRCNSCSLEHDPVTMGVWYTYSSDNLFTAFPPEARPAAVLNVQFYTSGHQYDVLIDEIALLASNTPPAPQVANG
ncbi:MAG: hypothetical protein HXY40_06635 [Chloroflexi bacterium]|nr:hypothetical protein [Chloroflexota bacterium]